MMSRVKTVVKTLVMTRFKAEDYCTVMTKVKTIVRTTTRSSSKMHPITWIF